MSCLELFFEFLFCFAVIWERHLESEIVYLGQFPKIIVVKYPRFTVFYIYKFLQTFFLLQAKRLIIFLLTNIIHEIAIFLIKFDVNFKSAEVYHLQLQSVGGQFPGVDWFHNTLGKPLTLTAQWDVYCNS